jgi:hypothetical protein
MKLKLEEIKRRVQVLINKYGDQHEVDSDVIFNPPRSAAEIMEAAGIPNVLKGRTLTIKSKGNKRNV